MGGGRYWTEREVGAGRVRGAETETETETEAETGAEAASETETEAEAEAAWSARFASPTIERGSMGWRWWPPGRSAHSGVGDRAVVLAGVHTGLRPPRSGIASIFPGERRSQKNRHAPCARSLREP